MVRLVYFSRGSSGFRMQTGCSRKFMVKLDWRIINGSEERPSLGGPIVLLYPSPLPRMGAQPPRR